jgi:hypothetical protein
MVDPFGPGKTYDLYFSSVFGEGNAYYCEIRDVDGHRDIERIEFSAGFMAELGSPPQEIELTIKIKAP